MALRWIIKITVRHKYIEKVLEKAIILKEILKNIEKNQKLTTKALEMLCFLCYYDNKYRCHYRVMVQVRKERLCERFRNIVPKSA